jgi:phage baseplate assembly protein gpV
MLLNTTKKPENIGAAVIELATITDVHLQNYTVDVLSTFGHRPIPDVPVAMPYMAAETGAGINFMPQIGDQCYLVIPGDDSGPFILGFVANGQLRQTDSDSEQPDEDGEGPDYSGGRLFLESGDICLDTADGNFVILRRGGIVQIGATSLAQTLYIPIENLIRHFFQRYQMISPLGEVDWGHASIENGIAPDGDTAVLIKFNAREAAQDKEMSVELRVGRLNEEVLDTAEDPEHTFAHEKKQSGLGMVPGLGLVSITVNPQGAGQKYTFQIDKTGNNFIRTEGGLHIEAVDGFYLRAEKGARLEVDSDAFLEITKSKVFKAAVQKIVLEATSNISIKAAATTIDSSNVTLGKGPLHNPVLTDNGIVDWLAIQFIALGVLPPPLSVAKSIIGALLKPSSNVRAS